MTYTSFFAPRQVAKAAKAAKPAPILATLAVLATDQRVEFDERAAIAEFDGGLPRAHAEVLAALHADGISAEVIDLAARRLELMARRV